MSCCNERGQRKERVGTVVSNKMQKTVVVKVEYTMRHPRYEKVVTRAQRLYAHCEDPNVRLGDIVTVVETRPLSKTKRWRVASVKTA